MLSPPLVGSSSKPPSASTPTVSSYRLGTAAMMLPNIDATIEPSGNDDASSTSPARVLPKHTLSSEDNNLDDSNSAYSGVSGTHSPIDNDNSSDSASSSVNASSSNEVPVPVRPKARAPKKTLGKRPRADSNVSSASSNGAAAVPAKKRIRSNALMRSAPRATSTTTPGGLAGNSEFMYVYFYLLLTNTKTSS